MGVEALTLNEDGGVCIKVVREKSACVISRSVSQFNEFATIINQAFKSHQIKSYPMAGPEESKLPAIQTYLTHFIQVLLPKTPSHLLPSVTKASKKFFDPRDKAEYITGTAILRRDSGTSEVEKPIKQVEKGLDDEDKNPIDELRKVSLTSCDNSTCSASLPRRISSKNAFVALTKMVFGSAE